MEVLKKVYYIALDGVQSILIAFAVFLVIYMFLFRPYQVSGLSMYPTFDNGEYVLTNLIAQRFAKPVKGNVIVLKSPVELEKFYIKRVIATGGDSVMISNGDVYVNNKKLDESKYLNSSVKTFGGAYLHEGQPAVVPQDMYFVIGDNRPHSSDSREFGPIKEDAILGESMFVYWPINKARVVEHPKL